MFVKTGKESKLVNRRGRIIENPRVKEWCHQSWEDIEHVVIFGESYVKDGKNGQLYDLLSAKDSEFEFMPIDMLSINLQYPNPSVKVRREMVEFRMGKIVQCQDIVEKSMLDAFYKSAVKLGYEGIVVKPLQFLLHGINPCVKIKETDRSIFRVSKIEKAQDRIEVMVDSIQGSKPCGVKASSKQKAKLRVGDNVVIEHKGILIGGGLRHPVFIESTKESE